MKITKYLMTAVALMFGATAFADEGMWMIPVSYTHLTLPTILLV